MKRGRPPSIASTIRWMCEISVVVVALALWTGVRDPVQLPKATIVAVLAVAIAGIHLLAVTRRWEFHLPPKGFSIAVGAFIAAIVLAALFSESLARSIVGTYTRWSGVALYLGVAVFALAVSAYYTRRNAHRMITAMAVAVGAVTVYALVQRLGADPINWTLIYGDLVFSSLGNPNFASALMGLGVPVWAWMSLDRRWPLWGRVLAGGMVLLGLGAQQWTGSQQGFVASAVGLWFLAFVWLQARGKALQRWGQGLLGVGMVATIPVALAGYGGRGPLAGFDWTTVRVRLRYWDTALGMARDHPLLGVGPGAYDDFYREFRSLDDWGLWGIGTTIDATHSVPLEMLATGGIVLAAAYIALFSLVSVVLVRTVRRLEPGSSDSLLIGAVGGAWLGYLAVSAVSIDVPALALTGWLLTGLVVAVCFGDGTERVVKSRRFVGTYRKVLRAAMTGVLVLTLAGAWSMVRQYQADGRLLKAFQLAAADPDRAFGLLEEAAELAPWEPRYVFSQANLLDATGQQEAALDTYESAATVNKQWWDAHVASARLSEILGDLDRSALWYEEVLRIDPVAPDMKFEAGRVAFLRSDTARAVELLEAAVTDKADVADWWLLLAEARFAAGDEAGGQSAYEKAVEINPNLADPP